MKRDRVFALSCFLFLSMLHIIKAQGIFEDADKLSDFTGAHSGQHFDLRHTIPGIPEVDYPIYSHVPKTSFECTGRHEGYYADIESRCQAFRICTHTARSKQGFGFLCPNGTLFSQKFFVCDWYRNVDCNDSERFYTKNDINRIGSNFDMMETVRQMMEYPMKTISKALQQNPGASRKPTQINRGTSRPTQITNNRNKETETIRNRSRTNSSRKSVTRDQVESAHSRGTTKYIKDKDINNSSSSSGSGSGSSNNSREREGKPINNENIANSPINTQTSVSIESNIGSKTHEHEDVYVNSLGELSTDPGVTFDRTNAHIIAEPRRYRYEKYRMNFAEKVNAGLNDALNLPANESLAPDYIKSIYEAKEDIPKIDLPSNVNGLLDEIANDLNPRTSGYQVANPNKVKHSFRFLSRGFSSQNDPYKYKKPQQTADTVRFTPNQLPIEEDKLSKKPDLVIAQDAVPFGHKIPEVSEISEKSDTTSATNLAKLIDDQLPSEQQNFEEVPYLSPPDVDSIPMPMSDTTEDIPIEEAFVTTIASNTIQSHQEEDIASTDSPAYAAALVDNSSEPLPVLENSTSISEVPQNSLEPPKPDQNQHVDYENKKDNEDRVDVNKKAENLLISGLQLTSIENNSEEITTIGTETAYTPLLIQVTEDPSYLTSWASNTTTTTATTTTTSIETTTTPANEFSLPSANAETQAEPESFQERIRNYRRLANLQRASAKPLIYGKRAGMRMTKMTTSTTSSTTATPKSTSTTRSYLKRIAASRLRLSRLAAAAAGNKQNQASTISPTDNSIDASSKHKKLSIRNIDKETRNAENRIDESTSAKESGVVTWESVMERLQRFQIRPKKEEDVNTTIETKTKSLNSSSKAATSRNNLLRKRNRFNNAKLQTSSNNIENSSNNEESAKDLDSSISTSLPALIPSMSMTMSTSTSTSTSASPSSLSNLRKPPSLNFSSPSSLVSSSQSQTQKHNINSSTSTTTFTSSNPYSNGAIADNTNLNSKSASAPNNYIPFDKLKSSIVDDYTLQTYRSGPILGISSLPYETNSFPLSTFTQKSPMAYTHQTPVPVAPTRRPDNPQQHSVNNIRTTLAPPVVVARGEGQRINPNSFLSSLMIQNQPKPTATTSYVPLNDFLNKKFGNQISVAPTPSYSPQQYQQQQQFVESEKEHQVSHIQQQSYQQQPLIQQHQKINNQQYQHIGSMPIAQYQQKPQQFHQPQYQIATATQQQHYSTLQQHQQEKQINYSPASSSISLQQLSPPPTSYYQHNHANQFSTPNQQSLKPLAMQNIFTTFKQQQQQQQLPAFPPLSQSSPSTQRFDGNSNYLNLQLPTLTNGIIPVPTNQIANKRTDIAVDKLELADFTPAQSVFNGATSYDVPLNSIGRLPNDLQALLRRLRKY